MPAKKLQSNAVLAIYFTVRGLILRPYFLGMVLLKIMDYHRSFSDHFYKYMVATWVYYKEGIYNL